MCEASFVATPQEIRWPHSPTAAHTNLGFRWPQTFSVQRFLWHVFGVQLVVLDETKVSCTRTIRPTMDEVERTHGSLQHAQIKLLTVEWLCVRADAGLTLQPGDRGPTPGCVCGFIGNPLTDAQGFPQVDRRQHVVQRVGIHSTDVCLE